MRTTVPGAPWLSFVTLGSNGKGAREAGEATIRFSTRELEETFLVLWTHSVPGVWSKRAQVEMFTVYIYINL